jgi:N-formylglutamate amidohydrolase
MVTLEAGLTLRNSNFSVVLSHPKASRVVISVPQDTLMPNDFLGSFARRKRGIHGRDRHVWPIVHDCVRLALKRSMRIDTVRFLFPRAFIDANREAAGGPNFDDETLGQTAYDAPELSSVYETYHGEIARLIGRSCRRFGSEKILFVDMHGFGVQPERLAPRTYDLILGTASRTTISHGSVDRSFAGYMRERGYTVFLPEEQPVCSEGDPYSAGHTTRFYSRRFGVNAIQIEIARRFRVREGEADGKRLAADMAEFFIANYA